MGFAQVGLGVAENGIDRLKHRVMRRLSFRGALLN